MQDGDVVLGGNDEGYGAVCIRLAGYPMQGTLQSLEESLYEICDCSIKGRDANRNCQASSRCARERSEFMHLQSLQEGDPPICLRLPALCVLETVIDESPDKLSRLHSGLL